MGTSVLIWGDEMKALVTEQDLKLIKSAIMLPMVLKAFERDKQLIEATIKTPLPYSELLDLAIQKVIKVHSEVKRAMVKSGVKIYVLSKDEYGVTARYLFRGYHGEMTLLNEFIKAQCSIRMMAYLGMDTSKYSDPTLSDAEPITM